MKKNRVVENVKAVIGGTAFVAMFVGAMLIGGYCDSTYNMECKVVDTHNTEVVVEDASGEQWVFDAEKKYDYRVNDTVKVVFAMNGTEHYRYDDEIIKVKKVGK